MRHPPAGKIGPWGGTSAHRADPPLWSPSPPPDLSGVWDSRAAAAVTKDQQWGRRDKWRSRRNQQFRSASLWEDVGHNMCERTLGCATRREQKRDLVANEVSSVIIIKLNFKRQNPASFINVNVFFCIQYWHHGRIFPCRGIVDEKCYLKHLW